MSFAVLEVKDKEFLMNANKKDLIENLEKKVQKADSQKKFIVLSVFGFIFFSVLYLSQTSQVNLSPGGIQGRGLASIDSRSSTFADRAYEQGIAHSLNSIMIEETSLGKTPTPIDQFIYGELKGYYQVESVDGKISSIEFNTGYLGNKPIAVSKIKDFLEKNRTYFTKEFQQVHLVDQKEDQQKFDLLDGQNQVVGQVLVELDGENLLKKIQF